MWKQSGKRRVYFRRERNLKVTAFDYWRRQLLSSINGREMNMHYEEADYAIFLISTFSY